MALKFKNGQPVKQVMPAPIEGVVTRFNFDETTGVINYVVSYTDALGEPAERVFSEDQIEAASVS